MKPMEYYLDYAASTPVDPRVFRAMRPYFSVKFGNPGSFHRAGAEALAALDRARETVARAAGTEFRNVVFTASATEANNLALRGTATPSLIAHFKLLKRKPKIIVSAVEHDSVFATARDVAQTGGGELAVVPVDRRGIVDLAALERALDERTVLVSVMYVNNEVGAVQPIHEIAEIIRNFRNSKRHIPSDKQAPNFNDQNSKQTTYPLFHVDAAQAFLHYPCKVKDLGADLMTLSSQKVYGPKGAGALCINSKHEIRNPKQAPSFKQAPSSDGQNSKVRDLEFEDWNLPFMKPMVTGGGQEFGIRAGTENVPAIVGFGAALGYAEEERAENVARVGEARDAFVRELRERLPGIEENIPASAPRAPHLANIAFPPGVSSEDLLVLFDRIGVAASPGAACSARALALSHVLRAMGLPDERIRRSIRFSFGRPVTPARAREAARRIARAVRDFLAKAES